MSWDNNWFTRVCHRYENRKREQYRVESLAYAIVAAVYITGYAFCILINPFDPMPYIQRWHEMKTGYNKK